MGWFNTMLNMTTAASAAYSAAQLRAMRQQQAEAAAIQAILAHLRNQVFQLRQMAETALSFEAQSPKVAAGALSMVEAQLQEAGIVPDLFPDLTDKEYTAQTWRLVANNLRRLREQLSLAEQAEVRQVLATASRLPDYDYYLKHYEDGRKLAKASEIEQRYAARNGCLARILLLTYLGIGTSAFASMLGGIVGITGEASVAGGANFWLTLILLVVGVIVWLRWTHRLEYDSAKRTVARLRKQVDEERFKALDQEFGDPERARILRDHAQAFVDAFFENRPLPPPPMLPPAPSAGVAAAVNVGAAGAPATPGNGAGRTPEPTRVPTGTAAAVPPPQIHVQKRTEAARANARVVQGPPDHSGEPQWIVRSKEQEGDARAPLGQFRCPECGRLYYVPLQPARLELFCLACGQGITVHVA